MAKPIDLDDKRLHDEQGFIIYYILYKYIIHISQLKNSDESISENEIIGKASQV